MISNLLRFYGLNRDLLQGGDEVEIAGEDGVEFAAAPAVLSRTSGDGLSR